LANGSQPLPTTRAQEAIAARFNKAFGQDMLQEAADELLSWKRAHSEFAGFGGAVAKRHLSIGQFQNAVVADGDAKDVRRQVPQGREATADRLAMHHPGLSPYRRWNEGERWVSWPKTLIRQATCPFASA